MPPKISPPILWRGDWIGEWDQRRGPHPRRWREIYYELGMKARKRRLRREARLLRLRSDCCAAPPTLSPPGFPRRCSACGATEAVFRRPTRRGPDAGP